MSRGLGRGAGCAARRAPRDRNFERSVGHNPADSCQAAVMRNCLRLETAKSTGAGPRMALLEVAGGLPQRSRQALVRTEGGAAEHPARNIGFSALYGMLGQNFVRWNAPLPCNFATSSCPSSRQRCQC